MILVGGKGKRLRPLSTNARPKAFLSITQDGKTMFRLTLDRIKKIIPAKNIIVVANRLHASLVKKDFPNIDRENLLLEPVSRNTAPAVTFAAAVLKKRRGGAIMVVLPSDQYIEGEEMYRDSIKRGIDFLKHNPSALLALGIRPAHPATGLGYIKVKSSKLKVQSSKLKVQNLCAASRPKIYKAERFVEKPNLALARQFIEDGGYLWNAGAFIFGAGSILKAIRRFSPEISNGLSDPGNINSAYKRLTDISIDYAVMEKAKNIYCMECGYGWKDMGSFEALGEVLRIEERDFVAKDGRLVKIL